MAVTLQLSQTIASRFLGSPQHTAYPIPLRNYLEQCLAYMERAKMFSMGH